MTQRRYPGCLAEKPDGKPLNGHRHAFFLPLDENGDGRIDHLLVTSLSRLENRAVRPGQVAFSLATGQTAGC